jgi:phenylalanyl-tRNA synthetase beta chain
MKIVLSWLRDLVPVGEDAAAVAADLSMLGMAVEEIVPVGAGVPGVVTARVLETERHPDAAKVHRVYVDAGDGERRHVWCGAFNMAVGDVVPLATLGTTMPDGRTIERRGILGIPSEGMLCSAAELGVSDDHSGILILPRDTPLGLPVGEALGARPDVVLDLDLTRNRPETWGLIGIARDLAPRLGVAATLPDPVLTVTGEARTAPVTIVDGDRCGRFTTTVMSGVRVGPSAEWMAERLRHAGMRPINNVVDVSNYVMLELNQPNHAYDLDTLGGGGIRVRCAAEGETITTLDGATRTLAATDLLICDATDRPIGIGGIMGGLDTEITDTTTVVALEIAWFEPAGIAASVTRLGLRSEASARFERGVDPHGIDRTVARFAELLRETCPDLVVHAGAVDARSAALPAPARPATLRVSQARRIAGIPGLTAGAVADLLGPIGFTVHPTADADVVTVDIPSWRPDCEAEIDVVEEIARQHGYDRIERTVPKSVVHGGLSVRQRRRRQLREVLLGLGLSEAMPNPFLAPGDLARAGVSGGVIRITNPLVAEESVLRSSLRPGLLKAVAYNESHRSLGVRLFEIGHVYPPADAELPDEREVLGVAIAGAEAPAAVAVWREIAAAIGAGARLDQGTVPEGMHPGRSATLSQGRDRLGVVGEVHPDVCDAYGITERLAYLELDLTLLLAGDEPVRTWKPVSRFPSSDIDLAFAAPATLTSERIEKALKQGGGALVVSVALFDVYRGEGLGEGTRSLAYRLRLQAPDRTLTDAEISRTREAAITAVTKLGATLR